MAWAETFTAAPLNSHPGPQSTRGLHPGLPLFCFNSTDFSPRAPCLAVPYPAQPRMAPDPTNRLCNQRAPDRRRKGPTKQGDEASERGDTTLPTRSSRERGSVVSLQGPIPPNLPLCPAGDPLCGPLVCGSRCDPDNASPSTPPPDFSNARCCLDTRPPRHLSGLHGAASP